MKHELYDSYLGVTYTSEDGDKGIVIGEEGSPYWGASTDNSIICIKMENGEILCRTWQDFEDGEFGEEVQRTQNWITRFRNKYPEAKKIVEDYYQELKAEMEESEEELT